MKYKALLEQTRAQIEELMPWDLADRFEAGKKPLIIDVREPYEYDFCHIPDSILVPRGVLESACEWDYTDTVPELVEARNREVVIVCRSGYRSAFAAYTLKQLDYAHPLSLNTGLRGWNDYDQPLIDYKGERVDPDAADDFFNEQPRKDQLDPARRT